MGLSVGQLCLVGVRTSAEADAAAVPPGCESAEAPAPDAPSPDVAVAREMRMPV